MCTDADLDVELLRPIQPLLSHIVARTGARAILGEEPHAHALLLESVSRQTCNALLASEAGHPFFLWLLQMIAFKVASSSTDSFFDPDDPVGTTGPRALEGALVEWEGAYTSGSAALVYVLHADALYPLWDSGQADTFREKCKPMGQGADRWANWANTTDIEARGLGGRVVRLCARLEAEEFKPQIYPASFTSHHWAHTWLADKSADALGITGASEGDVVGDVVDEVGQEDAAAPPPLDAATLQALVALDADLGRSAPVVAEAGAGAKGGFWRGLVKNLFLSWL